MKEPNSKAGNQFMKTLRLAKRLWPNQVRKVQAEYLRTLLARYRFSLSAGDLQLLGSRWYVTHAGLLSLARRNACRGIRVQPLREFCDPAASRWVFKAIVYNSPKSKGFVGYGDADPSNVSALVRGAEMRVAETRAVNRALRKAYGIGLCSVEELGACASPTEFARKRNPASPPVTEGVPGNGQPRLRDRLCLLIRQHQLDPTLVKRYAADFCGTETIREASRELVEAFTNNLAEWASKDRAGLLCHLNSFSKSPEAKP